MDRNVSPQNSYVEVLTSSVTLFEDRTFKEIIKVKRGQKGGHLCPGKKRKRPQACTGTEKRPCEDTEGISLQVKKSGFIRNQPCQHFDLGFHPPEL